MRSEELREISMKPAREMTEGWSRWRLAWHRVRHWIGLNYFSPVRFWRDMGDHERLIKGKICWECGCLYAERKTNTVLPLRPISRRGSMENVSGSRCYEKQS